MKDKTKSESPLIGERSAEEIKPNFSNAAYWDDLFMFTTGKEDRAAMQAANHVWDDFVLPLEKRIKELESQFKSKEESLPEATYEQSDIKMLADLVEILYEANGTGSGAGDIQDYIKKHFVRKVESKNKAFGEWISVDERLPELVEPLMGYDDNNVRCVVFENWEATVLAYDPEIGQFRAKLNKFGWQEVGKSYVNGTVKPTHWMPLPSPPRKPE